MSPIPTEDALTTFRNRLDGEVLIAGDPGWDAGRQPWNLITDQEPGLVVHAASTADVVATVELAKASGMRVAPQGTGHGSARMPDLSDAILLRTAAMGAVDVDPGARTARVGAGAQWASVVGAVAPHGLAALHGSSGTVGVAGYIMGGGVGWLARGEGFACNHVVGFEVVTADGQVRRVGADSEPDLFWALRGGGGGHAIVTEIEIELVELASAYAGALMWPMEQAAEIAEAWRRWTETVPETVTSTIKLLRFPPFPELPEPLRGRELVAVTLAFRGGEEEGAELVAPLRAVSDPYLDMVATVPVPALAEIAGDPKDPVPGRGNGFLLSGLDEAAIRTYVELAGPGVEVPLIGLEMRHLGGALDRSSPEHGALDTAGASYLMYGIGAAVSPELDGAITGTLKGIAERMAPWRAERTFANFAELDHGITGSFSADVTGRLERVRADYDPEGMLVGTFS